MTWRVTKTICYNRTLKCRFSRFKSRLREILSWFVLFHLPSSPSQLQTPSTIAVTYGTCIIVCFRLTVCLPAWLSGSDPLPTIDFVLDKRLWISWFPWPRFCGRCRNIEFTITFYAILLPLIPRLPPLCPVTLCSSLKSKHHAITLAEWLH